MELEEDRPDPKQRLDYVEGLGMAPHAAAPHTTAIHNLVDFINTKLEPNYKAEGERCVMYEDTHGLLPDVVVYKKVNKSDRYPNRAMPMVIIEVFKSVAKAVTQEKIGQLLKEFPELQEGFGFNYETKEWVRLRIVKGELEVKETNKSVYLGITIKTPKTTIF